MCAPFVMQRPAQRASVLRPNDVPAVVATPGLALQRVRREPGGQAVAYELCRPAQRLARCLVVEGGDELLGEAQTWIARKHLGTQIWRNILGAPPRDVHARREFEEMA